MTTHCQARECGNGRERDATLALATGGRDPRERHDAAPRGHAAKSPPPQHLQYLPSVPTHRRQPLVKALGVVVGANRSGSSLGDEGPTCLRSVRSFGPAEWDRRREHNSPNCRRKGRQWARPPIQSRTAPYFALVDRKSRQEHGSLLQAFQNRCPERNLILSVALLRPANLTLDHFFGLLSMALPKAARTARNSVLTKREHANSPLYGYPSASLKYQKLLF